VKKKNGNVVQLEFRGDLLGSLHRVKDSVLHFQVRFKTYNRFNLENATSFCDAIKRGIDCFQQRKHLRRITQRTPCGEARDISELKTKEN
jgi:hypothetical protein